MVVKNAAPDDLIISTIRPVDFYLDRLDYFYLDLNHRSFRFYSACMGSKEIWTGANLLYTESTLFEALENPESVKWVIIRSNKINWLRSIESKIVEKYPGTFFYRSVDGAIDVYKIG
jgi:hypothetical protein